MRRHRRRDRNATKGLAGPGASGAIPMATEQPRQTVTIALPQLSLLAPAVMGPPIVWLASAAAAGVHDQRIVAIEFEDWLARR